MRRAEEALADGGVPRWQEGYVGPPLTSLTGLAAFARFRAHSFADRCCLEELSGSLGDMGTLIPLLAACASAGAVRLGPAMFWMGLFNVVSAVQWDIPMPVQPMKSIAAVAIVDGLSPGAFSAAGILTGATVWILGVTHLIEAVNRLMAKSVIAGIQVGLGVKMAATGFSYWETGGWLDLDGKLTFLCCLVFATALLLRTRLPAALIVFLAGCAVCAARMAEAGASLGLEPLALPASAPKGHEWVEGLVKGTIPQLPLTTLNSVVSVCALSIDLFRDPKDGGKGVSRASVATSVGLMNVVGCWFGAMPSCHGAGGLAGQYKFGARGGCSILLLGIAKVALALTLGQSLDSAVEYYPRTVLGVLLLFAGVELAAVGIRSVAKSPKLDDELLPCLVTAAAYIGAKNVALGACAGLLVVAIQSTDRLKALIGAGSAEDGLSSTAGLSARVVGAGGQRGEDAQGVVPTAPLRSDGDFGGAAGPAPVPTPTLSGDKE